jgi:glycosyltransferase involved in cell wall biosynthesis
VEPGQTGLLVPPGQPQALATAVLAVLGTESSRQMGAAGRRRIEERFSLRQAAAAYAGLYEEVRPWLGRGPAD